MYSIMTETYFDILGVDKNSSSQEIKKAYRQLSMKWHPDRNNSLEAKGQFQKISEAYETLGSDTNRHDYNNKLQHNRFASTNDMSNHVNIDELFSSLFGIGRMGHSSSSMSDEMMHDMMSGMMSGSGHFNTPHFKQSLQKPTPIIKTIEITLDNVLMESNMPIEIERWVIENGTKMFEKETIYVSIPNGIDDNEIIVLRNKGNVLNDGCIGDIKLFVRVKNNSLFKRSGLDLILEKTITLKESLCGFSFEITHLNGKSYTLNSQLGNIITPGHKKTLPNMGLTRDTHKGNMIVIFKIDFPICMTIEQIDQLTRIL